MSASIEPRAHTTALSTVDEEAGKQSASNASELSSMDLESSARASSVESPDKKPPDRYGTPDAKVKARLQHLWAQHTTSTPVSALRTLSRDFTLPQVPSAIFHESCASLRDQFLRVRDRFSATGSKSRSSSLNKPLKKSSCQSDSLTKRLALAVDAIASRPPIDDAQTLVCGPIEHWYVEDCRLRRTIMCTSLEAGAAVVARIANAAQRESSNESLSPDLNLQWVDQSTWSVTVTLVLPKVGSIADDHVALAQTIEDAIVSDQTPAQVTPDDLPLERGAYCWSNQYGTLVLKKESNEEIRQAETLDEAPSGDVRPAGPLPSVPEDSPSTKVELNVPNAPAMPEKMGWLKKKTGINSWKLRYFELKGNHLYYFKNDTDGMPKGAILMDQTRVTRARTDDKTFTITASKLQGSLQVLKFSSRKMHHAFPRKSFVLRIDDKDVANASSWIDLLNRASRYWRMDDNMTSANTKANTIPASSFRPGSSSSSSSISTPAEDDGHHVSSFGISSILENATLHHFGSVKYLQATDPLLWEIHPQDQAGIRKRAATAQTRQDYLTIFHKHASTFRQIFLPRPQSISLEQTLRDILPERFVLDGALFGGGLEGESKGLEDIFDDLDAKVKQYVSDPGERVRAVSAILQACARTISGGDAYFVVHNLLGNDLMVLRPAENRGHPIEIKRLVDHPGSFRITVHSSFSFHRVRDVEEFSSPEDGHVMTPSALLSVHTQHIQDFDLVSSKSLRWLCVTPE